MTTVPIRPSPPAGLGEDDDARLIARSRERPEAFAELYDRHAADLHRYVTRRLGADLADDVVGETFLIAFRRRPRPSWTTPGRSSAPTCRRAC
ncbi:RNA polymerase sigma factor [Streptomyces sp. NPDC049040]|uniref:RNA polymerase sigma factor n=1 Tax=Streptomyces sp. NPDC049040 TaxID=3365593 RepID=UPI0037235EC6